MVPEDDDIVYCHHIFDPTKALTLCGEDNTSDQLKIGYFWTDNIHSLFAEDGKWPHNRRVAEVDCVKGEYIALTYDRQYFCRLCTECYSISKLVTQG